MENQKTGELAELAALIKTFVEERDWDQFHSPKDVGIGLVTESAELLELFRFKSDEECAQILIDRREDIADELADVFYWLLRFSDKNGIDLAEALRSKMKKNAAKYPVEKSRGKNLKYDEY